MPDFDQIKESLTERLYCIVVTAVFVLVMALLFQSEYRANRQMEREIQANREPRRVLMYKEHNIRMADPEYYTKEPK